MTCLHHIALEGNIGLVKLLLERGADPEIVCKAHGSVFDIALHHKKYEIDKLLRSFISTMHNKTNSYSSYKISRTPSTSNASSSSNIFVTRDLLYSCGVSLLWMIDRV